ncbi:hypothetical protein [Burkholderia ubonensis]|uniref:hypothetical protein n=1 Tax=Burkholderia ubonensis TaxID=101571 RepID=UPI000A7313AF|nr:hypothetical protein [Burkholderia ubonensis]
MRSIDPEGYAKKFSGIEGVQFFNLQLDAVSDVEMAREASLCLTDHTGGLTSFDETATYLSNLDIVITACTSVANPAGGLGVRTWLLLDVNPHWVWMIEREDSSWDTFLKLDRQLAHAQWEPVLKRVESDLSTLVLNHKNDTR